MIGKPSGPTGRRTPDGMIETSLPGMRGRVGWLRQKHQAGRMVGLRRLRLRRLHELLRGGGGGRGSMSMAWR